MTKFAYDAKCFRVVKIRTNCAGLHRYLFERQSNCKLEGQMTLSVSLIALWKKKKKCKK